MTGLSWYPVGSRLGCWWAQGGLAAGGSTAAVSEVERPVDIQQPGAGRQGADPGVTPPGKRVWVLGTH